MHTARFYSLTSSLIVNVLIGFLFGHSVFLVVNLALGSMCALFMVLALIATFVSPLILFCS
jgi:hypothetical protein